MFAEVNEAFGVVDIVVDNAAGDHGNSPLSITEIPQVMTAPENRLQ
jgi:hypothetical protein